MDSVFIHDLSVRGKHGVYDRERETEQEFLFDISADFDTRKAAETDAVEDTMNYSTFRSIVRDVVQNNSFFLVERLADTIAQRILEDVRIMRVTVTVRKPDAYPDATPGVTIVRDRT